MAGRAILIQCERFAKSRNGNVAVFFALVSALLLCFVGAGIDFSRYYTIRASLSDLADSLALRGAREFLLANTNAAEVESMLRATAVQEVANRGDLNAVSLKIDIDQANGAVTVALEMAAPQSILLSKIESLQRPISAEATAVARGSLNVCVIALDDQADKTLSATLNAEISAADCALYSNSSSPMGVYASGYSKIGAEFICSGGGSSGTATNFDPDVTTDCPVYKDPLAKRTPPTVGACTETNLALGEDSDENFRIAAAQSLRELTQTETTDTDFFTDHEKHTLNPGVYCGGLNIAMNADVKLNPGVYIIKDGPLTVGMQSRLVGENIAFYLVGDEAVFSFAPDTKISLTAPTSGAMAGILFFEDRGAPVDRMHKILSDDARMLLGTFYLPRGTLLVSTLKPVADQSAYTAIVAKRLTLSGSPKLVLNTDYALSDVPVPSGIGPVGGVLRLRD